MRRLLVAAGGLLAGLVLAAGLGACDCDTIDRPLLSGTYTISLPNYALVLDLEGGSAVETYTESDPIRVEYAVTSGP